MSDSRPAADPRLLRAFDLLRSVCDDAGLAPDGGAEPGAWTALGAPGTPPAAIEDGTWLVSSTDVLLPWQPATAAAAPAVRDPRDPWDAYFAPSAPAPAALLPGPPSLPFAPPGTPVHQPATTAPLTPLDPVAPLALKAPAASTAPSLSSLTSLSRSSLPDGFLASHGAPPAAPGWLEEPLDGGAAAAAADCLYAFLRACGRRDVEAAMALVAGDYHAIEGDREVDREALRHRLEELLDERRGGDLEVAATAPLQPIPYVDGLVLVPVAVQIDHRPPSGLPSTLLCEWVAVLEAAPDGWRICGLGPQRDLPADAVPAAGDPSDAGR